MDMRTVEKIEYGSASAVRVSTVAISDLDMPESKNMQPVYDYARRQGYEIWQMG